MLTTNSTISSISNVSNVWVITTKTASVSYEEALLSDALRLSILWYSTLVVNPVIGSIGLISNLVSATVIIRSGLRKPSNILLLTLAIADMFCMFKSLNVGWLLSYLRQKIPLKYPGWEMSYMAAYTCYVVDKILVRVSNYAAMMSSCATVLITLERCVAIFLPLQFSSIVTPRRAWFTIMTIAALLLPIYIFKAFLNDFSYVFRQDFNVSMGTNRGSVFYRQTRASIKIFENFFIPYLEVSAPLAFVIFGCVVISVKLTTVRRKQRALVQGVKKSTRSSQRTTNTLLMVCLMFSLTRVCYLFIYLPIFDDSKVRTRNVSFLFVDVRWTLIQVNSACNIVVYVLFNPTFKRELRNLLVPRCCLGQGTSAKEKEKLVLET